MIKLTDKMRALARRGDVEGVKSLLNTTPDLILPPKGGHGRSLLWEAVRHGRSELVDLLLDLGANVNSPGRNRAESLVLLTPLAVAQLHNREVIAEKLFSHGVELSVYDCAFLGNLSDVKEFTKGNPKIVNIPLPEDTVWKTTPLHYAAANNQIETAKFLCQQGAEVKPHGPLLLDFAARRGSRELLDLFIKNGANAKDLTVFSVLIGGNNAQESLPFLIKQGLDINGDNYGYPGLVYGSRGDKGEHPDWIMQMLHNGANVHIRDRKGRTALHVAASAGFCEIAKLLLQAGADITAQCNAKKTPMNYAKSKKRVEMIELLQEWTTKHEP